MSATVSEQLPLLAAAPNGIEKLRELIVELAVRGKLLPMRKVKWQRRFLGEIGAWGSGGTPLKTHPEYYNGDIPWLVIGDLNEGVVTDSATKITTAGLENSSAKLVPPGTVLIAMYGSIGKLGIAGIKCATNQAIAHCQPTASIVSSEYLFVFLRSVRESLIGSGQGLAQQNISQKILKSTTIDLPPLDLQASIVAKVDELMALCDRLEAQQADAESAHAQLVATLLDSLTRASDGDEFAASWQRLSAHFHTLFTTESSIDALKQSLLQLAVMGMLVPQDPSDEPVREMLRRIAAKRMKAGNKIRKRDLLTKAGENDRPFEVPTGWEWTRLGDICLTQTGATPSKNRSELFGSDIPFIRPADIYSDLINYEGEGLSSLGVSEGGRVARAGSLLMVCIGTIGKCNLIERDCSFNQQINSATLYEGLPQYLRIVARSTYFQATAWSESSSTTISIINKGKWEAIPVPLPSETEQHRIVAKVDKMMVLCDQLKSRLIQARQINEELATALVQRAVA